MSHQALDNMVHTQLTNEAWMLNGACVGADPEWFFPTPGDSKAIEQAMDLCRRCDLRPTCLAYALKTDSAWGVWGATTEGQRRKIKENSDAA